MQQTIDTARAKRRPLRFGSIDEVLADLDAIVAAEQAGTLRCSGNWSAGQVFGHLATWIEYGFDGYPFKPPPLFIRWILRWQVKRILRTEMPAGARIPGVPAGTYGVDQQATEVAAARLRKALDRLKGKEPCPYDSPAFGAMSYDDRVTLNLRHAALHMSFLHPSDG